MERPVFQGKAPYQLYKIGTPFYHSGNKRFQVMARLITGNCNNKVSVNYARYIMEIHLGKFLETKQHVHHKDGNALNDVLDNLEVITLDKHTSIHKKSLYLNHSLLVACMCCGKKFVMNIQAQASFKSNFHKYKNPGPYCSASCSQKVSWNPKRRRDSFSYKKILVK